MLKVLLFLNIVYGVKSETEQFDILPKFFYEPFHINNSDCLKHSKTFVESLNNASLWAYESKFIYIIIEVYVTSSIN